MFAKYLGISKQRYNIQAGIPSLSPRIDKVSKRQTNRLRRGFLAPEDESMSKNVLLERFAKYTLSAFDGKWLLRERRSVCYDNFLRR